MKLLFITPGKLPVPATSGGAVETLIQIIIDYNERTHDHDITLISVYTEDAYKKSLAYKYTKFIFINIDDKMYRLSRIIRYLINRIPKIYIGNSYIKRVMNLLKDNKEKYDYVIVENAPQYALLLKKKYNNLIFHSHNNFLDENTDMAKKILNSYKKVFSLSNYISNRIRDIDHNYGNIYTLYNGVELDKFNVKKDNFIGKKFNLNKDDFIYLYTGRIVKEKGVKELIQAFNLINDNNSKLLIVGDIDDNTKYCKTLKKLSNKNKNIIFSGKVPYGDIPKYYKASNVGIVPSVWEEPFALTVIEHMSVGNPIIITKSGAMPELVNDKCAMTVEKDFNMIENLLNAMINIKKEYKSFNSILIKEQANKFNSDIYYNRFNELLKK